MIINWYLKRKHSKIWSNFIRDSEFWSADQFEQYQFSKLKNLLEHSYRNVPYYSKLFKQIGFQPGDLTSLEHLRQLPVLTKDTIRERIDEFFPTNINKNSAIFFTTGGSTGEPLGFYRQRENQIIEKAFMLNQWSRVGYNSNSTRAILRGEPVAGSKIFEARGKNTWLFSSYHLSGKYISQYIDTLNRLKPEYFHVYPSSFFLFTQLMLEKGLYLDYNPKAILCGSENLYDHQRTLFRETFRTKVYSWLGLAEQTTLAGECEQSSYLHAWPQHSIVEIVDASGKPVCSVGDSGLIIGTNLHNYYTPFIRYESGDKAVFGGNKCVLCGRSNMLFAEVLGREQYSIVVNENLKVPITAITFGLHFDAYKNIKAMQIQQTKMGSIIVRIDPLTTFSEKDKVEIMQKMKAAVSEKLSIQFELDRPLLRNKNGKLKYFISIEAKSKSK